MGMTSKVKSEIIDLLEQILAYAEFDKKHLPILKEKIERIKLLKNEHSATD